MAKNETKMPLPKLDELFTTEEESDYVLKVLPEVIRKLNKISPYQRELKVLEEKFKEK